MASKEGRKGEYNEKEVEKEGGKEEGRRRAASRRRSIRFDPSGKLRSLGFPDPLVRSCSSSASERVVI
jgi:hypothetical protein